MNPTSRPVAWPAGHAFAYLHPFEANATSVKLTDVTDCISTNKNVTTPDVEHRHMRDARDDKNQDTRNARPNTPSHVDRLSELRHLGVKVGTDSLTPTQCEKLSAVLYPPRSCNPVASGPSTPPHHPAERHKTSHLQAISLLPGKRTEARVTVRRSSKRQHHKRKHVAMELACVFNNQKRRE